MDFNWRYNCIMSPLKGVGFNTFFVPPLTVDYLVVAGGGGGGRAYGGGGGAGAEITASNGSTNTGGGGGGAGKDAGGTTSGNGGSGIVVLRYPDNYTITIGAGLTGSTATDGTNKVTTITAGTGNVSWA
jgi:hypothetical protein